MRRTIQIITLMLLSMVVAIGCDSMTDTNLDNSGSLNSEIGIEAKSSHGSSNIVEVTPDNLMGWTEINVRGDGLSEISDEVSDQYGGNGSLSQSFSNSSGKTDFRLLKSFGPVSDLTTLKFDWYRNSSSSAPDHLTPAVGIFVDDGNGNSWLLKWEGVYNAYPSGGSGAPTDEWITENILNDNFWRIPQYQDGDWIGFGGCGEAGDPYECFQFDRNLDDSWLDGYEVVGIEIGIGSGWNGSFQSHADYVTVNNTTFDFDLILNPETKNDCKKGGWQDYGFKNQGQCIRFVNTGKDSR